MSLVGGEKMTAKAVVWPQLQFRLFLPTSWAVVSMVGSACLNLQSFHYSHEFYTNNFATYCALASALNGLADAAFTRAFIKPLVLEATKELTDEHAYQLTAAPKSELMILATSLFTPKRLATMFVNEIQRQGEMNVTLRCDTMQIPSE
jgi:hypothetical protein